MGTLITLLVNVLREVSQQRFTVFIEKHFFTQMHGQTVVIIFWLTLKRLES